MGDNNGGEIATATSGEKQAAPDCGLPVPGSNGCRLRTRFEILSKRKVSLPQRMPQGPWADVENAKGCLDKYYRGLIDEDKGHSVLLGTSSRATRLAGRKQYLKCNWWRKPLASMSASTQPRKALKFQSG